MNRMAGTRRTRRRGTALVGVLACLLVGTLLTGLTVQSALRGRREARLERQRLQTEWLLEGGLIRAVKALQASNEYAGETWQPDLQVEPLCNAEVEIKVKPAATDWVIQVVARLDSTTDSDGPMQRSGSVTLKRPSEDNPSTETKSNLEKSQ